jgi:hypothetical protein
MLLEICITKTMTFYFKLKIMKCEWCNKKAEVRIYGEHLCTYHYLRIYIDELKKDKNENTNTKQSIKRQVKPK